LESSDFEAAISQGETQGGESLMIAWNPGIKHPPVSSRFAQ
jgi:hypothetical protein